MCIYVYWYTLIYSYTPSSLPQHWYAEKVLKIGNKHICIYVYIYMYIYIHICIYMGVVYIHLKSIYTHTHSYTPINRHTHIYTPEASIHTFKYTDIYIYIYIYAYIHTYIHIYIYTKKNTFWSSHSTFWSKQHHHHHHHHHHLSVIYKRIHCEYISIYIYVYIYMYIYINQLIYCHYSIETSSRSVKLYKKLIQESKNSRVNRNILPKRLEDMKNEINQNKRLARSDVYGFSPKSKFFILCICILYVIESCFFSWIYMLTYAYRE
jgi:hypothetical protein